MVIWNFVWRQERAWRTHAGSLVIAIRNTLRARSTLCKTITLLLVPSKAPSHSVFGEFP